MFKFHFDTQLMLPVICLGLLGVLILRSVAPSLVNIQIGFYLVAGLVFFIFSVLDYRLIFSLHKFTYILCLLFLLLPYVFGTLTRGSFRWIPLGPFSLQPSEVAKPVLLITFSVLAATVVSQKIWQLIAVIILPALIIFRQPDLGTTLVLLSSWVILFLSKIPAKLVFGLFILSIMVSLPAYHFILKDYQRQRIVSFFDPYRDPLGQGYHVIQSIIAVGSGGFTGRGLGQGTQSQLRFLPEHHTDFIFASIGEELGFAGSITALCLYLLLIWRIYKISQLTPDPQAALYCLGSTVMLAFQIFVNIGMDMGIVPITGITLPFISYGGSSLLSLGILMGILNSISATLHEQQFYMIK